MNYYTPKNHKPLGFLFIFLGLLLLFSILLISCKAKQNTIENTSELATNRINNTVTTHTITRNPASADSLKRIVDSLRTGNRACDSLCNDRFYRFLQEAEMRRSSGGTATGIYYDKYKKMLVVYSNQAETISELRDKLSEQRFDSIIKKTVTIRIPVPATFSREQKFSLWTGRIFWVILAIYVIYRFRKKIITQINPTL